MLPETVEVYSVELPGHGRRLTEPPLKQLDLLVQTLAQVITPALNKPFAFFGHSLGGLIVFELAQYYISKTQQKEPFHLWISAARAPHLPYAKPVIHALPDADFIAKIRRYNGTPDKILNSPEMMSLLLPSLRADFALLETYCYSPKPLFSCPITAFWGENDKTISQSEVADWQKYTSNTFSLQSFSGDHFFVHQPEILSVMKSQLSSLSSFT